MQLFAEIYYSGTSSRTRYTCYAYSFYMFLWISYRGNHRLPHVRLTIVPDVCLMFEPMDSEAETEADGKLGMEPSAAPAAPRQSQVTTNAPIPDQISMDIQTDSPSSVPSSTTVITTNRSQVLRICNEVRNVLIFLNFFVFLDYRHCFLILCILFVY